LSINLVKSDEFSVNEVNIKLYHSLIGNNAKDFTERGSVTLINGKDSYLKQNQLSIEEIALLKEISATNGNYYLKGAEIDSQGKEIKSRMTFMKACSLLESSLSDTLTITLDLNGRFLAISSNPSMNPCCHSSSSAHSLSSNTKLTHSFNTTVHVIQTMVSPGPETQSYILRLEQEKVEKMKGEKTDNRSFFAKYWMYIIPVVVFLLISGASGGEGAR